MQPSLLLVLLSLTLAQGKQEILEKDTQLYPSSLHNEETQQEYNYVPVANTPERKCPRFQYFDCKKCVPMRNGDHGSFCACEGWKYDDFMKECRPSSVTPPPSNCEADLQQCQNEMQKVKQELQNCRENCSQKPSPSPPQQPGKFEYDRDGDYRCKFIPSNGGGHPGPPCKGPLKPDFWSYPQGKIFKQPNRWGTYPPAELMISGPAVLEVSDHYCRVAQYEVTVNGQSLGKTSNTVFDRRCWGDSRCWNNMDTCISQGFSHGLFQIPSGFYKVQIHWVNGDFRGWTHNQGLYRVFDVCPGQA